MRSHHAKFYPAGQILNGLKRRRLAAVGTGLVGGVSVNRFPALTSSALQARFGGLTRDGISWCPVLSLGGGF